MRIHPLIPLLATSLLWAASPTAGAAPVTRWFQFSSTSGPLQFGPSVGRFTYDDAQAPAQGGVVTGDNLLIDLELQFAGQTWTELNTDSVELRFQAGGQLTQVLIGANCSATGSCSLTAGADEWYLRAGVPGTANDFAYIGFGSGNVRQQSRSVNGLLDAEPAGVPEPGMPALVLAALAALALTRRGSGPVAPRGTGPTVLPPNR